jgi:hypothetical protein
VEPAREILFRQSGVITRRQLHRCGHSPADLKRMCRRRELVRVAEGVFVDHTGPLTWLQRAWAGVLTAGGSAALFGTSALRAMNGPGLRGHDERGPIHVAVDRHRSVASPNGVVLHRVTRLHAKVLWNMSPPRMRAEEAVLDVAAAASRDADVVAALAAAVQGRLTTADRLLDAVSGRARYPHRTLVRQVLADVAEGACSALEHAYLVRVERAHALPTGARQVRASIRGPCYRDVEYAEHGVVVELDGRLDHSQFRDRDADLDRDLDALVEGSVTARLGWGQVVGRPCLTALRVHRLLTRQGQQASFRACRHCVTAAAA